jgi:serine/threonine protein kinase
MDFRVPSTDELYRIFPQFARIKFLHRGGFKAVFTVEYSDGKKEALKLAFVATPDINQAEEDRQTVDEIVKRVSRELLVLRRCKSPFVVKLGMLEPSAVHVESRDFIAYSEELLDGENLEDLVEKRSRPEEPELRLLASCLFRAIQELWGELKIVHRDIKPSNVIKLHGEQRPFVLLDFGIAFSLRESSITRDPSAIPGTLPYLAPEMLQSNFRETLDFRSDLYTTALTVYEYATGVHPFRVAGQPTGKTLYRILRERPKPLHELRPDLSERFCNVVNQLLKKLPAIRPSNLQRLISLTEDVL